MAARAYTPQAAEKQIERYSAQIARLKEKSDATEAMAKSLTELHDLLPRDVTPGVATAIGLTAAAFAGGVNGTFSSLPEPILPFALAVTGIGLQFADIGPDAAEAANAVGNAGGAIIAYGLTKTVASKALTFLRELAAPKAA